MNILHGTMSQPVNRPEPYFYDRVVYTTTGAVVDIEDFENRPLYPETVSISGVSTITETGTYTFTNDINVDSFTEPIKSVTWTNADKIDNNSASITVNNLPSADQTVTISCEIEFEKGYTKTISKQVTIVEGPYTPSISSMTIDGTSIASGDTLRAGGLSSFSATISEYRSNHTVSILLKQSGETVLTLGTFSSTSVNTANSTTLEDGSYSIVFVVDGDSTEYATVTIEDREYVEIGGLKWATMNIGANSVTDAGLYFQWGDTQGYTAAQVGNGEGQKEFSWSEYKFNPSNDGLTFTKYTDSGKTVLDLEDDAARTNWGGAWRMPTIEELEALSNAVNAVWTTDYNGSGINGLLCTDKTDSSKVLFFPAAGVCDSGSIFEVGVMGYAWSSSLKSDDVSSA